MLTHNSPAQLQDLARKLLSEIRQGRLTDNTLVSRHFGYMEKDITKPKKELYSRDVTDSLKLGEALATLVPAIKKVSIEENTTIDLSYKVDSRTIEADLNDFLDNGQIRDRLFFRDKGVLYYKKLNALRPKKADSQYWKTFGAILDVSTRTPEEEGGYFLIDYGELRKELVKREMLKKRTDNPGYLSEDKFRQKMRNFVNNQFKRYPQSFGLPKASADGQNILEIEKGGGIRLYNPII